MSKDQNNKKVNQQILESKKIIAIEKQKIRNEKRSIRKKKIKNFKKTKFGRIFMKIFFIFDERDSYTFGEVFSITIFSLILGAFVMLSLFTMLFHGRNYFTLAKDFDKLYDVYGVLSNDYYLNVDKDELIESAIKGMVNSVGDVYTNYGDEEAANSFDEMVSGIYEGIGCTIQLTDNNIKVVEVYEDSPAEKAGLKSGDIIKEVDDLVASDIGTTKLANYIKKEANENIKMKIIRDDKELNITLIRDKVEMPTITSKVLNKNNKKIGYLTISIFSSVTAKQFKKTLEKLEKDGIDSLIIDVRNNSGGYLTTVDDILEYLLPKGKIMYQLKNGDKKEIIKDKTNEKRSYPIAILTNSGSASASEILAAGIKESYNGFVVGTKTYGKGTVQQMRRLSDGSIIKYTIKNWLSPEGNWIDKNGVTPTHEVELDEKYMKEPTEENDNQLQKALNLLS